MPNPKIFWFAMAFSTVIYFAVLYTMFPVAPRPFEESLQNIQTLVLYGVACASFFAGLVVPGQLVKAPPQTRMIITLAIFESCAIYGLLAGFLQQDWRLYIPAWVVSLIGMARAFPKDEQIAA
ncbi:MAG TPA: hypothetical protein VGQ76_27380 [Thermoanaerobaculia bacterium]|jgi:hypothetical protein|nr:hypothetical protein [Thermoanaerobaculia bacterium]